ncbi:P-type conjugative transfer protein VirB9 [Luteimonas soli]|uniref:P-type conjugative transfer protein VirB9 n=1 Tax=Luteimonas soli TaxID=1648966 RepID=A0ABV7XIN1_9GAMM
MRKHLALALSLALLTPVAAVAATKPIGGSYDPRVKTVNYNGDDVVVIMGHYGFSTNIEFAPGENVQSIALGDSLAWEVAPRGNQLFVKPREDNATTNMTVVTDKRSYQFWLDAAQATNKGRGAEMYFRVKFNYPREEAALAFAAAERQRAAAALKETIPPKNYNYWACGNPRLRPTEAYDDGRFTYLRFPGAQEIPAAYVINSDGAETLANGTMRGDQLVLQTTAAKLILRKGKAVACLENRSFNWYGIYNTTGTTSPSVRRTLKDEAVPAMPALPAVPADEPRPAPESSQMPALPFQLPLLPAQTENDDE